MVHRENLFDGDLVAGIITALIVMILFSIYAIISPAPASTRKQVFRPYPTVSPKDIPDAPIGNQQCFSQKIECIGPGPGPGPGPGSSLEFANQCEKKCGGGTTFGCTKPGGPLTPAGRIKTFYNGMELDPDQHYCLPRSDTAFNSEDASSTVNPNTGVWEWVDDSDYCATLGDKAVGKINVGSLDVYILTFLLMKTGVVTTLSVVDRHWVVYRRL